MRRRIGSVIGGAAVALLPLIAGAQEAGGRATDAPSTMSEAVLYTLLALGGVFVLASLGYLYRVKRDLNWRFQEPDAPHDEHH